MQTNELIEHTLDWNALGRHGLKRKKIFQSILFPVDFSAACRAAAPYVRSLADLTGGRITLLHVIPWRSAWYGASDIYSDCDDQHPLQARNNSQLRALHQFRDEFFGANCEVQVECGRVEQRIVEYAEHRCSDLIMMSCRLTHELLQGSTLSYVLREAPCPVWIAPRAVTLQPFTGFRSIVCALSPSAISGEYVNETVAIGAVFHSRVTFASALQPQSSVYEDCRVSFLEEEYPEAGLDQLASGSRCKLYVETGPVGPVIRHVAELQTADLVVVNQRSHVTPHGHARDILRHSPCPVLTLPSKTMGLTMHMFEKRQSESLCMTATASVAGLGCAGFAVTRRSLQC